MFSRTLLIPFLLLATGCTQEMANQRRVESQERTDVFADGTGSQPIPPLTIPAGELAKQSLSHGAVQENRDRLEPGMESDAGGYLSGTSNGELVNAIPDRVLTRYNYEQLIRRGQQRFNISCVPCHDQTGSGNGMVARRGLKFPPSYHTDHLRGQPLGYLFNVVTHGRGQMPAYGDYLPTDDRWAIVAYVRTLQFSQYATASDLTESDLKQAEQYDAALRKPSANVEGGEPP